MKLLVEVSKIPIIVLPKPLTLEDAVWTVWTHCYLHSNSLIL